MIRKRRLIGLDLFRIICITGIFIFHLQMHLQIYLPIVGLFFSMGGIFMTGFFMLSGFLLYYMSIGKGFNNRNSLKYYFIKRIITIFPVYWFIAIIHPIYDIIFWGGASS